MMTKNWFAIACVAALGACGSKDDGKGGETAEVDVAAVNAAVPSDLASKLVFEAGTIEHRKGKSFKAAVPKGWKKGFMPGELEPADADHFGSKTLGKSSFQVSTDCNGTCEPKDWAEVSDKVMFSQFTGGKVDGKVIKDEKGDNRRTLVFEDKASDSGRGPAVRVMVAWWQKDSSNYFRCEAELGEPIKGAVAAFEKACANIVTPD